MILLRSRSRVQFAVATAMFAVCIGIGSVADVAVRAAVSWLATASAPSSRLQLAFTSGAHVMRLRNLTSESWRACQVVLDGGYVSPPISFEPHGRSNIPYAVFASATGTLDDREGFGRAFRSTAVNCADWQQQREVAVLR
ncbi:MAG TPA: hypothetical protein VM032_04915 [Vicinamibacterales bacterium]|nr:hypothetical protein [Vicinamibacterales bacterium]